MLCFPTGGLFEVENLQQELAFKYAVDRINRNDYILPNTMLLAEVRQVIKHDSFNASKEGKTYSAFHD